MVTLQFIPYGDVEGLSSEKRIGKVLSIVKENKIVLLEGRLEKKEEAKLIQMTMEDIDDDFRGIELSVLLPKNKYNNWVSMVRNAMLGMLLGKRIGFTVVGPANIVREIRSNPGKIELFTKQLRRKKKCLTSA